MGGGGNTTREEWIENIGIFWDPGFIGGGGNTTRGEWIENRGYVCWEPRFLGGGDWDANERNE